MKKVLVVTPLLLSLVFCMATLGWADGLKDAKAGKVAQDKGDYDEAIRLYTKAIGSGEFSQKNLSIAYNNRGLAWKKKAIMIRQLPITPRPSRLTRSTFGHTTTAATRTDKVGSWSRRSPTIAGP